MEKRTRKTLCSKAPSRFREEQTIIRRVRIGRAIVNGTLGTSNSPLLLHGVYDPEDADPNEVLKSFNPFAKVNFEDEKLTE